VGHKRLNEKSFRLCRGSNPDLPVVQPVARRYTELPGSPWASLETKIKKSVTIFLWVHYQFFGVNSNMPFF
jgi:hypothetical protein